MKNFSKRNFFDQRYLWCIERHFVCFQSGGYFITVVFFVLQVLLLNIYCDQMIVLTADCRITVYNLTENVSSIKGKVCFLDMRNLGFFYLYLKFVRCFWYINYYDNRVKDLLSIILYLRKNLRVANSCWLLFPWVDSHE